MYTNALVEDIHRNDRNFAEAKLSLSIILARMN